MLKKKGEEYKFEKSLIGLIGNNKIIMIGWKGFDFAGLAGKCLKMCR